MNGSLHAFGSHHQIHPMVCSNGYYPNDFLAPQPIDDLMCMDDYRLDQILSAYGVTRHDFLTSRQQSLHMLCTTASAQSRSTARTSWSLSFGGTAHLAPSKPDAAESLCDTTAVALR